MNILSYRELLNDLNFEKLKSEICGMAFADMEEILYELAYDPVTEKVNFLVYTFLESLMYEKESSRIHLSLSKLTGMIWNHLYNAESVGLFHAKRALALDPDNVDILEFILYYNHIPEKLLSDEDARVYARRVISKRPESLAAQMTLSTAKR